MVETCLSVCWDLPAGFVSFSSPDVDSVEGPRPQTSQHVRGAVRPDWDLPTSAIRGVVGEDVAIYFSLGWSPWHAEAGLRFISGWEVSGSIQFYRKMLVEDINIRLVQTTDDRPVNQLIPRPGLMADWSLMSHAWKSCVSTSSSHFELSFNPTFWHTLVR